jgi:hypothetical protein
MCSSCVGLSVAYNYFFEWGSSGPLPSGLLPAGFDMDIDQRVSAQSLSFGLNVAY